MDIDNLHEFFDIWQSGGTYYPSVSVAILVLNVLILSAMFFILRQVYQGKKEEVSRKSVFRGLTCFTILIFARFLTIPACYLITTAFYNVSSLG